MESRKKILLIEDQFIPRIAVTNIIKQCSCDVDIAGSGEEALILINQNAYDLIFMDIGLPDMDGLKLTQIIRSKEGPNSDVPIIALTAHGDDGYKDEASQAGMDAFIQKPMAKDICECIINQFSFRRRA